MKKKFTFAEYKEALKGCNDRMKDLLIQRAIDQNHLDWPEIKALVNIAHPSPALDVC